MISCFALLWIFVLGFIGINPIMRRKNKKLKDYYRVVI